MKRSRGAARLALTIAGLGLAAPGFACGVQTPELLAGWQARKAQSIKIPGQYRDVSRAPSGDGIVKSGVVVRPDGRIVARVNSREFPDAIILCRSGRCRSTEKAAPFLPSAAMTADCMS